MMKTLITFLLLTLTTSFALYAQSNYADCITGPGTCLAAGGVVTVITVYTNQATGKSTVLPVRVRMFYDVLSNPLWYVITNGVFGTNVTVLPFQDVVVPEGYMLYWTGHYNPRSYTSYYPIIVESSTGGVWSNEFYFCLYGLTTKVAGCGPAPCPSSDSKGIVEAFLYDGSNTNGLDITGTSTNSIMGRFGLGACDTYDTNSWYSVSFVYFNLPPKPTSPPYITQPWTNILSEPFLDGWCGFDKSKPLILDGQLYAGFIMCGPNQNDTQNWRYPNSPCDSNPLKQFRVRFDGSPCCGSTCATAPKLAIEVRGGQALLSFSTLSGFDYSIYWQSNLYATNWFSLTPWITGAGYVFRTNDPVTTSKRFYQLRYQTNSLILP